MFIRTLHKYKSVALHTYNPQINGSNTLSTQTNICISYNQATDGECLDDGFGHRVFRSDNRQPTTELTPKTKGIVERLRVAAAALAWWGTFAATNIIAVQSKNIADITAFGGEIVA